MEMNYIDRIAKSVAEQCGDPEPTPDDMRLYRIYGLLVLTRGTDTTLKDVHDAWSAWKSETMPEHRSIVPFDQLTPEVQEMDRPYCEAIHEVARTLNA